MQPLRYEERGLRHDVRQVSVADRTHEFGQSIRTRFDDGEMGLSGESGGKLTWVAVGVLCVLYLIYPSLGIFELIPDSIPIVGSLDEAAATTGLWIALSRLNLNPFNRQK